MIRAIAGGSAFSVRIVRYWNMLPASVDTAPSVNIFMKRFDEVWIEVLPGYVPKPPSPCTFTPPIISTFCPSPCSGYVASSGPLWPAFHHDKSHSYMMELRTNWKGFRGTLRDEYFAAQWSENSVPTNFLIIDQVGSIVEKWKAQTLAHVSHERKASVDTCFDQLGSSSAARLGTYQPCVFFVLKKAVKVPLY